VSNGSTIPRLDCGSSAGTWTTYGLSPPIMASRTGIPSTNPTHGTLSRWFITAFDDGTGFADVWNESAYSRETVVKAQLWMVNPDIVVCNKKNVSRLLSRAFVGADGYSGDSWPETTQHAVPSEGLTLVYSTVAYMLMSLLSRKRLSEEVRRLYRQE
jgi:hypothetical protein